MDLRQLSSLVALAESRFHVTEAAERDKRRQVIEAEAVAEQKYVSEQRRADADAYAREKQAVAQHAAATAEAEALRTHALAEAEAEERRAHGERARAMVPVEVERAKVAIERDRVDNVVKPELEAREQHGKVAQEFELAKLRVQAEREVRVAVAQASATLFSKVQANLYGTPADVARISESFLKGQSAAAAANGFFALASDATDGTLSKLGQSAETLLSALSSRLAGPVVPDAAGAVPDETRPTPKTPPAGSNGTELSQEVGAS